jgi:hypothetical protein
MAIDLRDSRAKIERAEEHSDSLKAIISPMESIGTADDAYLVQLSAKLDRQSGYHVFRCGSELASSRATSFTTFGALSTTCSGNCSATTSESLDPPEKPSRFSSRVRTPANGSRTSGYI